MSKTKETLGGLLQKKSRSTNNKSIDIKREILATSQEEVEEQAEKEAEVIAERQDGKDPVNELRALAKGTRKKNLEKRRTKCTHWLSDEEIKMLAKLSKATGKPKYEILGTSIKYMYELVMEEKNERKSS